MAHETQPTWDCGKCGMPVPSEFRVCWFCGTSIDGVEDPSFVPEPPDEPVEDDGSQDPEEPWSGDSKDPAFMLITLGEFIFFAVATIVTVSAYFAEVIRSVGCWVFLLAVTAAYALHRANRLWPAPDDTQEHRGRVLLGLLLILALAAIVVWIFCQSGAAEN